jgi:hypothetical protein
MRLAVISLLLLLGACEGSFFSVSDRWRSPRISEAYAARDACLARNAASESATSASTTTAAREVARACASETEKLVAISNRDGDVKVAANIRENSEFRAVGYVLRARGQPAASYLAERVGSTESP